MEQQAAQSTPPVPQASSDLLSLGAWCGLFTFLAVLLMALPFLRYIILGWQLKLDAITNQFDPPSIALYFRKYRTGEKTGDGRRFLMSLRPGIEDERLTAEFLRLYRREFGRIRYIIPLMMMLIITAIEAMAAIQSGLFHARQLDLFTRLCGGVAAAPACIAADYRSGLALLYDELVWQPLLLNATAVAGLVGAYMWVVQDGITRMRSGDMLSSNIYWSALRMMIAAPLGIAVASIGNDASGPFLAFAIGAFPIDQISRYLRTLAAKQLGVTNDPDTDGDEVKKLIGINNDVAQRLVAESTSTVLELAKADPVWLTMRTNLDLAVVAELIDQAIVWLNLASARADVTALRMERLRASELGSATQIAAFIDDLRATIPEGASEAQKGEIASRAQEAEAMLLITAATLRLDDGPPPLLYDKAQLLRIFTVIAGDDGTEFLVKLKALSPRALIVPAAAETPKHKAAKVETKAA